MLYNYKFTLAQQGQIKNYKKENKFNHTLLNYEDIELSTIKIDCKIDFKKTIPLNIFEKYAIRLIDKADKIYSDMNIAKIAKLLHLDENLVKENLENLEAIDMINGINSDIITINKDENSIYLQYENKFKIESIRENYHLTKNEYEDIENYVLEIFKNNIQDNDKKYLDFEIKSANETTKNAIILNFNDSKFLLMSKDGINKENDLKFIDINTHSSTVINKNIPNNTFCHYDEFLPLLRDKLSINKNDIVVIGSQYIDKNNLDIFKVQKDNNKDDLFLLSFSDEKYNNRVFDIDTNDFVWIGDNLYLKEDDFIIESKDIVIKENIKLKLNNYFINKILDIEPNYNIEELNRLNNLIGTLKDNFSQFKFQTKKEIDEEVKKINTDKNKLYGFTSKSAKTRNESRKKINKLEESNNQDELSKYTNYMKNRNKILDLKDKVMLLEDEKKEIVKLESELNELNREKSILIPKESKSKIAPIEKELKKLERLKV